MLWRADTFLNYEFGRSYGPYTGWTAKGLSVDTNGTTSGFNVVWRYADGTINVWHLDENLNYLYNYVAGPYFGYDPGYTD